MEGKGPALTSGNRGASAGDHLRQVAETVMEGRVCGCPSRGKAAWPGRPPRVWSLEGFPEEEAVRSGPGQVRRKAGKGIQGLVGGGQAVHGGATERPGGWARAGVLAPGLSEDGPT